MKVILKRDVKGLGREGDLKEVKDGYARNLLLPTGAAVLADKGAVANWERHRDQREERDRSARADAEATAEKLRELKLEIPVKAGERGRLFGAVTSHQIADPSTRRGSSSIAMPSTCASRSRRWATTRSTSASCRASRPSSPSAWWPPSPERGDSRGGAPLGEGVEGRLGGARP